MNYKKFIQNYTKNSQDYIKNNLNETKDLISLNNTINNPIKDIQFKKQFKLEKVSLFLINDINLNVTPKNSQHLKKILQDDKTVSVI